MAEVFGMDLGVSVPSLSSSLGSYVMMFLVIALMIGVGGIFMWWYFQKRQYRFKIAVFENIAGQGWQNTYNDSARYLRLSKDGTEVLFLKKKKMPLTAYGKKMGMNKYWFAVGQDGGWYNIVLGDLDAKMGTLDIEPIDRDIKYVSVAMRKNAAENYGPKITWMDKYGAWVLTGFTMIIMLAAMFFLVDQMGNTAAELTSASAELGKAIEPMMRALGHVDSICSGGSGINPA